MRAQLHIRLVLVCPVMRAGLRTILSAQPDFSVALEEDIFGGLGDHSIVIADYATGIQAARQTADAAQILILTTRDKPWEVREAVDSGVRGYVLQGGANEDLIGGVRLLGSGISYLCATASRAMADIEHTAVLTPREKDVLHGLARGRADKEIARDLCIKVGTVKSHVKHLLKKLDANTRTHAVIIAIKLGLQVGL